jgi:hypothetical protein
MMKRLLLTIVFLLSFVAAAQAQYVKVLGIASQSGKIITSGVTSTTSADKTLPGATVTIYSPSGSGTIAAIYSTSTGTVKANPFTASLTDATLDFYITPASTFDVRISGVSGGVTITPFTRSGFTAPGTLTVTYNVKTYGAVGDGTSSLSTALWRAQHGIPASLSGAFLGGATAGVLNFGTLTFVDGTDTKDFVAFAYAIYLSEHARGTYTPVSGVPLSETIIIEIPPGIYNVNRLLGLYSSDYVVATNAVLVRSGTGEIFNLGSPINTVITGVQFQGGTNAIVTADSNTDATSADIHFCTFQGQTSYAVKSSDVNTATPKTLRITNNKFIYTAGGVYSVTNHTIVENNWFEFITTNPVLYNDTNGQAWFLNNRVTPGVASPPADYIVNKGQAWIHNNVVGGETPQGKIFVYITGAAQLTSIRGNVIVSDTSSYNIEIDVFPIGVTIENNWWQLNNGTVVDDNYVGMLPPADPDQNLATLNNTWRNNQLGNSATGFSGAFANGGLGFLIEDAGFARDASAREMPATKVGLTTLGADTDFTNLYPGNTEVLGGAWSVNSVTLTNNYAVAPDGSQSATRATSVGGGNTFSVNVTNTALASNGYYTFSAYVRSVAGANNAQVYNSTDSRVLGAHTLTKSTEWVRFTIPFYYTTTKTVTLRFSVGASGELWIWGIQINPGFRAAPYIYKNQTAAKSFVFPIVGPEKLISWSAAMPSTGTWKAGDVVFQTAPTEQGGGGSKYIVLGWRRITTGSGNTLNTD